MSFFLFSLTVRRLRDQQKQKGERLEWVRLNQSMSTESASELLDCIPRPQMLALSVLLSGSLSAAFNIVFDSN